jgi:hypothetical protein
VGHIQGPKWHLGGGSELDVQLNPWLVRSIHLVTDSCLPSDSKLTCSLEFQENDLQQGSPFLRTGTPGPLIHVLRRSAAIISSARALG